VVVPGDSGGSVLANIYVANVAYVLKTIYISERCKKSYISPRCKPSMWESVKNVKAKKFCKKSYISERCKISYILKK
jgi:hypothetical protein